MQLFLILLLTHILGDFVWQPSSWVQDKMKRKIRSPKLYLHISVHAVILIILLAATQQLDQYIWAVAITAISHYLIDLLKIYAIRASNQGSLFTLDQLTHLAVIVALSDYYGGWELLAVINLNHILTLLICVLLITSVASFIIKAIISRWQPEESENDDSLSKAGHYIGILERLFVFFFIISMKWEAIGFLIAAKSVFRFGDLKDAKGRKLTEYILIGTLISFGWAILVGMFYIWLMGQIGS
ncbi:MAG: DUF3307 domain-containing protein [Saprospiraceae bacterium]|nr:DUF3307 domain-containing protein [Saprospiraceae bacterium]